MKLKIKYIFLIAVLHLVCLVMSYFIFETNKVIFLIVESLLIVSVIISLSLYKQLIAPLTYLKDGIAAINDQDFNVKFLPTGKTEVDELINVYNRMIDELRNERTKQQEQHFFLEKLIQTSPTGIIILDFDGQVKQVNPKATQILGNEQSVLLAQLMKIKTGTSKMMKIGGLRTYKIQKSRFIDRGFERIFILIEEVTAEIFEAEKNVYNKVIRMMAHEVNNTIGPVNSIMQLALQQEENAAQEEQQMLKNALQVAIDRNQNLNIFMRNFADLVKLPSPNKKQVNLVALIRSVAILMQHPATEKNVDFKFDLPSVPYLINADVQQLEQVLINIVKNAIEAMDEKGEITFTLNTSANQFIITDNGKGISAQDTEQLFSPFFSTKKDGQGIGLTLVREILLNHGFDFSLKTIEKNNTEFKIFLV